MRPLLMLALLVMVTFSLFGCAGGSNSDGGPARGEFPGDGRLHNSGDDMRNWTGRPSNGSRWNDSNMSDDQRRQVMEEQRQKAVDACLDMAARDACSLDSPRGKIDGTCQSVEDVLVCTFDRQMRMPQ
jgi:hypothetical protein